MTADPRATLTALFAAFERHLEASAARRGEDDPTVVAAYDDLADAFESYDEALMDAYGEVTPLEVYSDDDLDEDDEDDGSGPYSGLDDEDLDEDDEDDDEPARPARR